MLQLCENHILRKFKKDYFIINIDNGEVFKIHELGFRVIEYLSEGYSYEQIPLLLTDSGSVAEKISKLLEPFWKHLIDMGIVKVI